MSKKVVVFLLLLVVGCYTVSSQTKIALGAWQTHFNYNAGKDVALLDNMLFYASEKSILMIDIKENAIQYLDKVHGMSDIGINCINVSSSEQTLVVAYENSNIDLYKKGLITNIPDILNKQLSGDKTINKILCRGRYAYLACGFGIVCLDLQKAIIKDTWFFQVGSRLLNVLDIAIQNDSIYAVTSENIFVNNLNNNAINDFTTWQVEQVSNDSGSFVNISMCNQVLLCMQHNSQNLSSIYVKKDGAWQSESRFKPLLYNKMEEKSGKLFLYADTLVEVWLVDDSQTLEQYINIPCKEPNSAVCTPEAEVYIALEQHGLVKHLWGEDTKIDIASPSYDVAWKMDWCQGKLALVHGGHNDWVPIWRNGKSSVLQKDRWEDLSPYAWNYDQASDLVDIKIAPYDTSQLFAASLVRGLVHIWNGGIMRIYNADNSSLQLHPSDQRTTRTMSLCFDQNQNLWISNDANNALSVRTKENVWKAYAVPYSGEHIVGSMMCDSRGVIWMTYDRYSSLLLFDNNGTPLNSNDDQWVKLNTTQTEANGPFDYIYCIAEDRNHKIWLGTNAGLKYYSASNNSSPSAKLLENSNLVPSPVITVNENDGLTELVLKSESVKCICIDGGNRKWVGTDNSGVFLFSEDATEQLLHFTTDNSPLLSNSILDIQIDGNTGEVYFATDKGLVSFRYTATEGAENQENLKIFPNPVRADYDGYIAISGLVEDSEVKITDARGALVYRTVSNGGTAVWDGRRFDGTKASTGVYYVFVAGGGEKLKMRKAGKILFIK